jgi:hypothetical protein
LPLHLVPLPEPEPESPGKAIRRRLVRAAKDAGMVTCPRCAGIEALETRVGVRLINGKPRGGTKVLICATCQRKGERVVIG